MAGSDRALQDALIRLLADAPFRDAIQALERGHEYGDIPAEHVEVLRRTDPERVRRFARFLARHYYYERIVNFYKYSRVLARWTNRWPEHVLQGEAFGALLPSLILGSRATAREVARLVQGHLSDALDPPPYAAELARYESAQMIAESGPRVWRSNIPPPVLTEQSVAALSHETTVLHFEWDLPALFPSLLAIGHSELTPPAPPEATRQPTALLFARTDRGRVSVLRWGPALESLVTALDGERSFADCVAAAGIPVGDALDVGGPLLEAGVIQLREDGTVGRGT